MRRLTMLLAALVVLAAGAFARLVRDEPPASPDAAPRAAGGAALFERHCVSCHAADELRRAFREGGATRDDWERLLAGHGEATDEEDRLILDHLGLPRSPRPQP